MALRYQSGEEIRKGDQVLWHGDPGEIEFVADPLVKDSATEWYLKEYGPGVMVVEVIPKAFGRVYEMDTEDDGDLVLVSRATNGSSGAKS
jgi:hypothetical protein